MTTDLNNILTALAAAKAAQEAVPVLEERNRNLVAELDGKRDHVQRIELTLQERDARINELSEKLRSVEAERDQYGFRELEANDKVAALVRSIRAVMGECEGVLATVETGFVPRKELEARLTAAADANATHEENHRAKDAQIDHLTAELQREKDAYQRSVREAEQRDRELREASEPMPMGDMQGTAEPNFMGHEPAPVYRAETAPEVAAPTDPTPQQYAGSHSENISTSETASSPDQPPVETAPATTPSDSPPTDYRGHHYGDWHWDWNANRYTKL